METLQRKSLLYKSGLDLYCLNHVQGCAHGCRYPCYAYNMARAYGRARTYAEWCRPKLVANAPELLAKELARLKRRPPSIHLCLTTDPFMFGYPEVAAMSLKLIAMINAADIPVSILTKGILPEELADRVRFPAENLYGISLVSLSEAFRAEWEPAAAPYAERIRALKALHDRGRRTRAHIEPYPTPNIFAQDLKKLLEAVGFVDELYFSGWNYNPLARKFHGREAFYRDQAAYVRKFCKGRGIECTT
jgi:DNA repair photolyase